MNTTDFHSSSVLATCCVCGQSAHTVWKKRSLARALRSDDLQITDKRYGQTLTLNKCDNCGFIFADDSEVSDLTALYEGLEDPDYETTQDTRVLQMRWLLDCTLRARPLARTWLDIGASTGLLVAEVKRRGLSATGVEPSYSLVAAAPVINGVELLQGMFPHPALAGRKFDVISLVDVIEHVSAPVNLLAECCKALTPEGVLLVVTPDVSSFAARCLGPRWWHYRLAHVCYFDRVSLSRAAERVGLCPLKWFRARWFFRVGYLAERMAVLMPIGWLNRFASRIPPMAWLYRRVIQLNLLDSWVVMFGSKGEK